MSCQVVYHWSYISTLFFTVSSYVLHKIVWKSDMMRLSDKLTFIICLLQRHVNLTMISIPDVNISQVLNEVSSNFP